MDQKYNRIALYKLRQKHPFVAVKVAPWQFSSDFLPDSCSQWLDAAFIKKTLDASILSGAERGDTFEMFPKHASAPDGMASVVQNNQNLAATQPQRLQIVAIHLPSRMFRHNLLLGLIFFFLVEGFRIGSMTAANQCSHCWLWLTVLLQKRLSNAYLLWWSRPLPPGWSFAWQKVPRKQKDLIMLETQRLTRVAAGLHHLCCFVQRVTRWSRCVACSAAARCHLHIYTHVKIKANSMCGHARRHRTLLQLFSNYKGFRVKVVFIQLPSDGRGWISTSVVRILSCYLPPFCLSPTASE